MLGAGEGLSFAGPTAVFLSGPPTPAADRLADAILAARPGVLFVAACG